MPDLDLKLEPTEAPKLWPLQEVFVWLYEGVESSKSPPRFPIKHNIKEELRIANHCKSIVLPIV